MLARQSTGKLLFLLLEISSATAWSPCVVVSATTFNLTAFSCLNHFLKHLPAWCCWKALKGSNSHDWTRFNHCCALVSLTCELHAHKTMLSLLLALIAKVCITKSEQLLSVCTAAYNMVSSSHHMHVNINSTACSWLKHPEKLFGLIHLIAKPTRLLAVHSWL